MREITKEQFSNDSTIDGRRIDKAVEDIVDRANAVEKRDMKRRFFQTQIVGAYVPSTGVDGQTVTPSTISDRLPFMSGNNGTAADNLYRVKGERRTSQTKGAPESLISTASFQFRKPAVITGFSAAFVTDTAHPNDFEFESPASDSNLGKSGDSDDVTLSISVDNPFLPENRALNSEVYHRFNFNLKSQFFRPSPGSPTADMAPVMPLGYDLDGVVVDDKGLNIPVPRDARVRVSVVLPDYTDEVVAVSGWGSVDDDNPNDRPWESQVISWTLTILEGAEE